MIFELLKTVTAWLDKKKIPYMVSGSLAFNIYCMPRMSMDIDFVIELNEANVIDFLELFKSGFYIDEETVREELKRKGMFNVIDHGSGLKMDFIIRKDSEYRRLEFSRKIKKYIDDIPVWTVSPEDLIISKLEWIQQLQSDKQSSDISMLLNTHGIDREYITNWCNKLKLNTYGLL
jgi:hypothetical protein